MHWIWNGTASCEISRDWGRYLILKNYGENIMTYDETNECLAVPLTVPLPKILARSAALCSGKAPFVQRIDCAKLKVRNDLLFYLYTEVPEVVAKMISQKMGQETILTKLK
jgi:hypothetical protein